jgi:hypothetical protein
MLQFHPVDCHVLTAFVLPIMQAAVPAIQSAVRERTQLTELQRQVSSLETMLAVLSGNRWAEDHGAEPLALLMDAAGLGMHYTGVPIEAPPSLPPSRSFRLQARGCACAPAPRAPHPAAQLRTPQRAAPVAAADRRAGH